MVDIVNLSIVVTDHLMAKSCRNMHADLLQHPYSVRFELYREINALHEIPCVNFYYSIIKRSRNSWWFVDASVATANLSRDCFCKGMKQR